MATAVYASATYNPEIDGLLAGTKWSGTVTYSFPDSYGDYVGGYGNGEPLASGFSQAPLAMQRAVTYAVALISSYTNLVIQFAGTNGADIAVAQSSAANPTSYAYYPSNNPAGGDVWFGTAYNYSLAALGNYYFTTAIHELGHAFGLKHSQETGGVSNVAVPTAHDDSEFTVMSYRSYAGGPLTGYTNESYGYPQTFMANDILALQSLYGANYSSHQENTVYSWSSSTGQEFINGVAQLAPGGGVGGSANRIFETVWDGNGIDTYDLSNYTTAVSINLNPGASSVTSTAQIAYLGNGHYAAGNIYNAYLYNNDVRSYIDNAIGGSGNDTLIGNAIANLLDGGSGDDTLIGGGGNDTILGGVGSDSVVLSGNRADYVVTYNSGTQTFTIADLRSGSPDGTDTVTGVENFRFADATFSSSNVANRAPVVTASNVQEIRGVAAGALSAHLVFSDADGDAPFHWRLQDVSSDSTAAITINGVALVPGAAAIEVTQAQFAAAIIQSVSASHEIWAVASDGLAWSSPVHFTVSPASAAPGNHAPVVTASNVQEVQGVAAGALSAHLVFGDADGDAAFHWRLQDVSSDSTAAISINGVALVPGAAAIEVTQAQFAAATIQAVSGSHEIWAVASDGAAWSSPVHFTVSPAPAAAANHAPVVTASNVQEVQGVAAGALSAHLAFSDVDGDTAFHWRLQDVSSDSTAAISINGVALVPGAAAIEVTQAQFAAAIIQAVPGSHEIWAVASDGAAWSSPVHFTVSPAANQAPVVTASDVQEVRGVAAGALSAHLAFSDADGDAAFHWRLQDVSSDSTAAISINGVALVPGGAAIEITQAQFAAAMIQAVSGSHEIWAVASDGTAWSSPVHFTVSPAANQAPVVTASNVQEVEGVAAGALSAHLAFSDADGDAAFHWRLQDVSSDSTAAISINGVSLVPGAAPIEVTQAQFAAAMIQAVSGSHEIWAVASDGATWSSPVHFTVSPAAHSAEWLLL